MATPIHPRQWPEVPTYPKTNRAPTRKYPSLSAATKNFYPLIFDLISHEDTSIPSRYNLANLLGCSTEGWTARNAEDAVEKYVQRSLDDVVKVGSRKKLVLRPKVNTVAVSPTTIPDGAAPTSGAAPTTEFIYEVDFDNNWPATRDKLLVQLARMLASLRNYYPNDDTNEVIGLYFPFENTECVVEITVQWSDEMITFVEKRRYLEEQYQVAPALKCAYEYNHQLWAGKGGPEPSESLNYPLSTHFLQSRNLEQIDSGQSIVLLDRVNKRVYKYPIGDSKRLTELYCMNLVGELPESTRIAFPLSLNELGTSVNFFEFKMYTPSLSKEDAQNYIVWFVEGVVAAVNQLHHAYNIAHLDIRLANLCIDYDTNQVVLIDLDRSRRASLCDSRVYELYGRHEMYRRESTKWTLSNLDWKQVGLMIEDIFSSPQHHDFIRKLIKEGTLIDQLLH